MFPSRPQLPGPFARKLAASVGVAGTAALALTVTTATSNAAFNAPIISAATGQEKAVFVLIHQGGWQGPDLVKQQKLDAFPGAALRAKGYRTVSLDYEAGTAGIDSIVNQIGEQLSTLPSGEPLCLYGESAGGQWALIAAARVPSVDCVITLGAPTDFAAWRDEAAATNDTISSFNYDSLVIPTFGQPGPDTVTYEPAKQAKAIRADVTLGMETNDIVIPDGQPARFTMANPTARTFTLPAGSEPRTGAPDAYLHGTVSPAGLGKLTATIGHAVKRAIGEESISAKAEATRCKNATTPAFEIAPAIFNEAVACLVRKARARAHNKPIKLTRSPSARRARKANVEILGRVTAATVVDRLLKTSAGRRALLAKSTRTITVKAKLTGTSRVHITTR